MEGTENVKTHVSAKEMLTGYNVTYDISGPVLGTWSWVTEKDENGEELLTEVKNGKISQVSQPLSAGTHRIKAKYTPNTNTKNLNGVEEQYINVTVEKVTPVKEDGYSLMATSIYSPNGDKALSYSTIIGTGKIYNPYTGEDVAGNWEWTDGTLEPQNGNSYSTKFVPTYADNYSEALSGNCTVSLNTTINIVGAVKGRQLVNGTETTWTQSLNQGWQTIESKSSYFTFTIGSWNGDGDDLCLEKFKVTWQDQGNTQSTTITPDDGGGNGSYEDNDIVLTIDRSSKKIKCQFKQRFGNVTDNVKVEVSVYSAALLAQNSRMMKTAVVPETESETSAPETTAPETSAPEKEAQTSASETTTSETTAPETESETSTPDTETETSAPDTTAPETSAPETESETSAPETTASETTAPETSAPAETEAQVSPQSETSAPATEAQTSAPETDPPAAEADEAA